MAWAGMALVLPCLSLSSTPDPAAQCFGTYADLLVDSQTKSAIISATINYNSSACLAVPAEVLVILHIGRHTLNCIRSQYNVTHHESALFRVRCSGASTDDPDCLETLSQSHAGRVTIRDNGNVATETTFLETAIIRSMSVLE